MRYLRLFAVQLRTSTLTVLQYRWDFLIDAVMSVFWALMALVPLWVFGAMQRTIRDTGGGDWGYGEMIVLLGWFTLLKGVLDGAVNPSLTAVVEHIRQGTLDFVLLKPADAQFLVSTAKFSPLKMVDVPTGVALMAVGFHKLGRAPELGHVAVALALLGAAALVLYAVWIIIVSVAFWVVRLDNLAFLFLSLFDFARWPVSVFKGALRIFFTVVVPLGLMTTYPAMALLGRLSLGVGAAVVLGALLFSAVARLVWVRAIGHYTSASS